MQLSQFVGGETEVAMQVFRDLYINATAESMAKAVVDMENNLPPDWKRDKEAEERSRKFAFSGKRIAYCFVCTRTTQRPAAMLILTQRDPGTFFVSNIVPIERHQLTFAEYGGILEDFHERVFVPAADKGKIATS